MKTSRIFRLDRIAVTMLALGIAAAAQAATFTSTFTNSFGDGTWERDAHIELLTNPNDPSVPGNWNTGAFPYNGHSIFDPNTGLNVPGDNPFYDVIVSLNGCHLGAAAIIQTLNVVSAVTLNIAPNVLLAIANKTVTNNGAINVGDGISTTTSKIRFDANGAFGGIGSVLLKGVGTTFNIADLDLTNATVTNGPTHTIHGLGTIIGFNGGLLINNGTIAADDASGSMQIDLTNSSSFINQNNKTIKAILR